MCMKLYVIRHGEVEANVKELLNGRDDAILTTKGISQVKHASELLEDIHIDVIICSPLRRTVETAKIINKKHIPIIYDNRILERDTRKMMYHRAQDVDFNYFYNLDDNIIYEDCEGFKSVLIRVIDFIEDIKKQYKDKSVLVVTRGDVCIAIYCYLNHINDVSKIIQFKQDNAEILSYNI